MILCGNKMSIMHAIKANYAQKIPIMRKLCNKKFQLCINYAVMWYKKFT